MSNPPEPAGRITLAQIAHDLGISGATVSNAFNRPDQLSTELRQRILRRAEEMGFSGPNPAGRSLRRGRTGAIGVPYNDLLSYAFEDPAFTGFLGGFAAVTEASGMAMLLLPGAPYPAVDAAMVRGALIDGFVIYSMASDDPVARVALGRRLPTVTIDGPRTAGVAHVGIDDRAAAAGAARHLLGLGHRRFGVLSLHIARDRRPLTTTLDQTLFAEQELIRERLLGYAAALAEAGITPETVPVEVCAENTEPAGTEAAHRLLAREPRPTAVLAMSDRLALGALMAIRDGGLTVPDDVSVVGFDDVPAAADAQPPLTTVRQPHAGKGQAAGRLLLSLLAGDSPGTPGVTLPSSLIVRGSSGPPG